MSPDARQIVAANPELERLRQRVKILAAVPPLLAVAAIAAFVVSLPAVGWGLAALAVAAAVFVLRLLLRLGGRIEAIQNGETGAPRATPKKPTASFFAGTLGKIALLCFVVAATAAVLSAAQFLGYFKTLEGAWLGPFFAALWTIVGFVLGGIAQTVATARLRERMLRSNGLTGSARILHFNETGAAGNDARRVRCEIEVTLPNHAPYRTVTTTVVPLTKVPLLTADKPVRVLVDPADPDDLLIDW